MFIQKPYEPHPRVTCQFEGEGRTRQSEADECDINTIMRRWQSGRIPVVNPLPATYGDFSQALDYSASLNQVIEADRLFDELPSDLRSRFENDPATLMKFIADPENRAEAEELRLVKPRPKPEPEPAPHREENTSETPSEE